MAIAHLPITTFGPDSVRHSFSRYFNGKRSLFGLVSLLVISGGAANAAFAGVESIGITPDGTGRFSLITDDPSVPYLRCYKDDALEAGRPYVHPTTDALAVTVADEEARIVDLAGAEQERNLARDAYELTIEFVQDAPDPRSTLAGAFAFSLAENAKDLTERVYQRFIELNPLAKRSLIEDTINDPIGTGTGELGELERAISRALGNTPPTPPRFALAEANDEVGEIINELYIVEITDFLKDARDAALLIWEIQLSLIPDGIPTRIADPDLQEVYQAKLQIWEEAREALDASGLARFEAELNEMTAVSDLPPCDSGEVQETLGQTFCTADYANPFNEADELNAPGIVARFDAFRDEVCAAVVSSVTSISSTGTTGDTVTVTSTPGIESSSCKLDTLSIEPRTPLLSEQAGLNVQTSFSLSQCLPGETVQMTIDFRQPIPAGATAFKVSDAGLLTEISPFTISGSRLTYSLQDNGPYDTDPTPGAISDPVIVAIYSLPTSADVPDALAESPTPVPTMPLWALLLMGGCLGFYSISTLAMRSRPEFER
jgi:hypothetical protein